MTDTTDLEMTVDGPESAIRILRFLQAERVEQITLTITEATDGRESEAVSDPVDTTPEETNDERAGVRGRDGDETGEDVSDLEAVARAINEATGHTAERVSHHPGQQAAADLQAADDHRAELAERARRIREAPTEALTPLESVETATGEQARSHPTDLFHLYDDPEEAYSRPEVARPYLPNTRSGTYWLAYEVARRGFTAGWSDDSWVRTEDIPTGPGERFAHAGSVSANMTKMFNEYGVLVRRKVSAPKGGKAYEYAATNRLIDILKAQGEPRDPEGGGRSIKDTADDESA